jgi:hypothetical protein
MLTDRLNLITTLGNNTGKTSGDVRMGRIKALLLTKGFEFTNAQLADSDSLKAAIVDAMQLSRTHVNKLFLFTGFREAEDNTGDDNVGTLGDGYEETLNEALAKYIMRHTHGVAQAQAFVAFNGWTDGVYVIDDNNILWYRGKSGAAGGGTYFQVGSLKSQYPRFGSTGAIVTGSVRLVFGSTDDFKRGLGATKITFSLKDLENENMVDVELYEAAAATGDAYKIAARTLYAGTDIYDSFDDLLAVTGAWKITKVSDGSSVAVSSVAKDNTNKCWTVTSAAGPTSGDKLKIELVDPAALAALTAPVTGIESVYVKVTKP